MSEKITYELFGPGGWVQANPANRERFEVELNFDKGKPVVQERVYTGEFTFVNEDHDLIKAHVQKGINGTGPGVCEGVPFRINAQGGNISKTLYDGMLNLRKAKYTTVKTNVAPVEKKSIDWLNEVAETVTFERMYEHTGEITNDDFIFAPYIINSVPDYKEAFICILTAAFITTELGNAIKELEELAVEAANGFETATAIINAITEVIYIIGLIIAIAKLIKDAILFMIQPVKYHAGMKIVTLFEKGCQHFGLTFKSDIFDAGSPYEHLCLIPEKFVQPKNPTEPRIFNFTVPDKTKQRGYYKGTFAQFIRQMEEVFAAKIHIKKNNSTGNTELHFLREDKNLSTAQWNIPGIWSPNQYDQEYTYNLDEFNSAYSIFFATDLTDKNTIQNYSGVAYSALLESSAPVNPDYKLSTGHKRVDLAFGRAHRKESLTVPEEVCYALLNAFDTLVNGIISAVNLVIGAVNSIINVVNNIIDALDLIGIDVNWQIKPIPNIQSVNLGDLIGNRIGMMVLETDSFNVQKLVILDIASNPKNTKININNHAYLSAEQLYKLFHFVRSFVFAVDGKTYRQPIHERTIEQCSIQLCGLFAST